MIAAWRVSARRIKRDTLTVYFACADPRTPILVRALGAAVAAYALSPFDLIPDFIPILGVLDDLIIVPLGVTLVMRLVPAAVVVESRARAAVVAEEPISRAGAIAMVAIWVIVLVVVMSFVLRRVD